MSGTLWALVALAMSITALLYWLAYRIARQEAAAARHPLGEPIVHIEAESDAAAWAIVGGIAA